MKGRVVLILLGVLMSCGSGWAASARDREIVLPEPRMEGGKPLMEALRERRSSRSFSRKALPMPVLSDLLWAAFGYNRPDEKKRTAPSARNWQEVDIYVTLKDAAYRYDPKRHSLKLVVEGDLRAQTGTQEFAATAPVNLVFVADTRRMTGVSPEQRDLYMGVDSGFISQNVYLFCASEGLATVVRGLLDREALHSALELSEHQVVLFAQSVGYPPRRFLLF